MSLTAELSTSSSESSRETACDFRTAYCRLRRISVDQFEKEVLGRALTRRARLLRPLVAFFHPEAFHAEKTLVRQAGDKIDFEDIRLDIDFYQHKNVVDSFLRSTLRFRISGIRLQRLAHHAFDAVRTAEAG